MSEPLQLRGRVLANERAGAYHVLTVDAPGIPERFQPGQFVSIAVGGDQSAMLARRAFSVYETVSLAGAPGVAGEPDSAVSAASAVSALRVVFAVHGDGTAWIAGLRPGATLDIAGPLGQPFTAPPAGVRCVLVGGGYGSAPLFSLADLLLGRGHRVDFVLGAATADRVFGADRARATAASTAVTTVDGSLGQRGVVTEPVAHLLGEPPGRRAEPRPDRAVAAVYACGPMPMLQAVSAVAAEHAAPVQVAVEELMACGIGVCMTCVLPVVGDDGVTRMTRSCVEGPVFSGAAVRWSDVGTVPADAWGAR